MILFVVVCEGANREREVVSGVREGKLVCNGGRCAVASVVGVYVFVRYIVMSPSLFSKHIFWCTHIPLKFYLGNYFAIYTLFIYEILIQTLAQNAI